MKLILSFLYCLMLPLLAGDALPVAGLGKASRSQVIAKLGAPESSYEIKRDPAQMPGECLEYPLAKTSGVTVRLLKGQMAQVTISCDPVEPAALLKKLGFTAEPSPQAGGTPIMRIYQITALDATKWEVKATLTRAGATTADLINLRPLP